MTLDALISPIVDLNLAFIFMFVLTLFMRWVDDKTEQATGFLGAVAEPIQGFLVAAWCLGILFIVVKILELWGVLFV